MILGTGGDPLVTGLERALSAIIATLAAGDVSVGARRIDAADQAALHPAERAAVRSAVARRQDEFATGRALLRSLIGRDVPIPMGPDRRPMLPSGTLASLAHDDEVAVAVAVRTGAIAAIAAIGVDVEVVRALDPDVAAVVARPDEHGIDPLLLFCAKEAAYKAWSQSGGGFLEHDDVSVSVDGAAFTARVVDHGAIVEGGWAAVAGRLVTVAVLRPGS